MGRAGNPCLTVETVVTTLNLAKIPAMIPLAIDLGADRIQLSALSPWEGVQDIAITQEQFASAIDAARAQACADAIRVEAPAATPAALCPPEQCALPRGVLHVDVDGVVHPCCMLSGVPLGNLTEQTPEQILSGPLRADFLRGMSTHPICGGCPIRRPKV
jgi:MoaA/NifB/PqqE/SkfB family radical SAM enzyme